MATRTVDEGFRDFLTQLTPTTGESEAAKTHRASIKSCLESNFGMTSFFRTGSFGNGTSISGYSDVDYFAVIPRENLKNNSSTTLTQVRNALATRFPNTGVRVDCPAVLVPFGRDAKESTEVVPADYIGTQSQHRLYEISDCQECWMQASPGVHNEYVREIDEKLGGKLKPLIRFIKAWKYYRNVPVSSFYLELRVAKQLQNDSSIVYSIDIASVLSHLENIELAAIRDPAGVSGNIHACSSEAKLQDALSKLERAAARARNAEACRKNDDISGAFEWWGKLYDGRFPSYYR